MAAPASDSRMARSCLLGLGLLIAGLGAGGCAWRSGEAAHYFGPVIYRYNVPTEGRPAVSQVVAIGMLAEAGRQWGLTLGVAEHTSVSPVPTDASEWPAPRSLLSTPIPERWNVSPLYVRLPGSAPGLVTRRLHGMQLVAGEEQWAASLGMKAVTTVRIPDDAFARIEYDSSAPLSTRFSVWRMNQLSESQLSEVLKEATR